MKFYYHSLAAAIILASSPVFAFEPLDDQQMSDTSGADGLMIETQATQITLDNAYWQDQAGTATTGGTAAADTSIFSRFDGVIITNPTVGQNLGTTVAISTNSLGVAPELKLSVDTTPFLFESTRFAACIAASGSCTGSAARDTSSNSGEWAIRSSGIGLDLTTTNGLFNQNGTARVQLLLDQVDIFITQPQTTDPTKFSQIILGDIRANIDATGRLWVDAVEGIRFNGAVSLAPRAAAAGVEYRAGLQFALKQKSDVGNASTPDAVRYNSAGAGNLIRLGVSGNLSDVDVGIRGINDSTPDTSKILGRVNGLTTGDSIVGSGGIGISVKGSIDPTDFSLELGESDTNTATGRSLQFSNIRALDGGAARARFDLGNIYVNIIQTSQIGLPISTRLSNAINFDGATNVELPLADANGFNYLALQRGTVTGGVVTGAGLPSTVTDGMLSIASRGLSIQGVPTTTNIINNNTGAAITSINGGLITAFNNLNSNIVFYGDNSKAGFALGVSTEGLATDNKSTTAVLIADTRAGVNRYFGVRNLDLLLQTTGTISMDADSIRVDLPSALLAFNGEFAVGNLMNGTTNFSSDAAVANNSKSDVLFGLRGKLEGSAGVNLIPNSSGALGIKLDLNLTRVLGDRGTLTGATGPRTRTAGSFLQIIEPSDGSTLGLENISGKLQVRGANINNQTGLTLDLVDDGIVIEGRVLINEGRNSNALTTQANDLRIGNINFYSKNLATDASVNFNNPQRLGEIAIAGGEIYGKVTLKLN